MLLQNGEEPKPRFEPVCPEELVSLAEGIGLRGFAHWVLRNGDGEIAREGIAKNLVTQVGDQYYAERAAGIGSPPGQVTGMRLGTGTTAAAKTSTGAAIVTYITGSNVAITSTFPTSGLNGSSRRITWKGTWTPGVATATLGEAVITNESPLTDVAGTAANTIARLVLSPTIAKGAPDTFELSWFHDLLGA